MGIDLAQTLLLLAMLCGAGCVPDRATDGSKQSRTMMSSVPSRLTGFWQRSPNSAPCAARYAASLQIDPNGLYAGQAEPPGEFTWWDSGTWKIAGPNQLKLSVATDEVITYRFELVDDLLRITDAQGCRIDYLRVT